jgi:hypothetical protein
MATVTKKTANWRLFGGGGLLVAGVLWFISIALLAANVVASTAWLGAIALLILVIGLVFVAFGQTGSNGAVGGSTLGRIVLVLFAVGWLLWVINSFVAIGAVLSAIAAILIAVGGLLSAWFVYRAGVAKGAASWILFVTALESALLAVGTEGWVQGLGASTWLSILVAALFALTGLLYLFNDRKMG